MVVLMEQDMAAAQTPSHGKEGRSRAFSERMEQSGGGRTFRKKEQSKAEEGATSESTEAEKEHIQQEQSNAQVAHKRRYKIRIHVFRWFFPSVRQIHVFRDAGHNEILGDALIIYHCYTCRTMAHMLITQVQ